MLDTYVEIDQRVDGGESRSALCALGFWRPMVAEMRTAEAIAERPAW